MHCPYCNGVNQDNKIYCTYCGRDMRVPTRPATGQYPPAQQPSSAPQASQGRPVASPQAPSRPTQPPASIPAGQFRQPGQAPRQPQQSLAPASAQARQPIQHMPAPVVAPEPPGVFPPHTLAELQVLEQGALPYTALESVIDVGRKKIVRIIYAKGVAWQQVATLLKVLKEQQDEQYESIIIQGLVEQQSSLYTFTNGQLRFDRNVRLGASTINRYQIETGNGFDSDSVRIVLNA